MEDAPQAFVEVRPLHASACHSISLIVFRLRVATSRPGYDNKRTSRDSDDPLGPPVRLARRIDGATFFETMPAIRAEVLLVHGNGCGPSANTPAPPVDTPDTVCGRLEVCNLRLWMDAEQVIEGPRHPEGFRRVAGLIASGAGRLPSVPLGTLTAAAVPTNMVP